MSCGFWEEWFILDLRGIFIKPKQTWRHLARFAHSSSIRPRLHQLHRWIDQITCLFICLLHLPFHFVLSSEPTNQSKTNHASKSPLPSRPHHTPVATTLRPHFPSTLETLRTRRGHITREINIPRVNIPLLIGRRTYPSASSRTTFYLFFPGLITQSLIRRWSDVSASRW